VTTPPVEDDVTILDEDILLRRVFHAGEEHPVKFVITDPITRVRAPTSASFAVEDDGLSLYLERALAGVMLGPESVVIEPMNAVAALSARAIRANHLGIVRDPNPPDVPDPEHLRHAAHCLAKGWEHCKNKKDEHKRRKALASASTLVVDPGAT
jgi:hypothetical protein